MTMVMLRGLAGGINNVVSLDVDAQNGFTPRCPEELPVPEGTEIVEELNRQARFAKYRAMSKDAHALGSVWEATAEHPQLEPIYGLMDVDVRWKRHCVSGTFGHRLIEGLPHPSEYDFMVTKGTEPDMHPYGACYQDLAKEISTGLIEWAQCRGVTTFIVGGLATDYCVKETVFELLDAGFIVILNLGGCRGIFPEKVAAAIDEMRQRGAYIIESADELSLV